MGAIISQRTVTYSRPLGGLSHDAPSTINCGALSVVVVVVVVVVVCVVRVVDVVITLTHRSNAVRGHRTGSNNLAVEDYLRRKTNKNST